MSFIVHFPFQKGTPGQPNDFQGYRCPLAGIPTGNGIRCFCNLWSITHPGTVMSCDGLHPPDLCPLGNSNDVVVSMQRQRIEVPG